MNYELEKNKLQKSIGYIEEMIVDENVSINIKQSLKNLKSAVDNDFFTVVVLGEFKRGKSTFINAMLGEELLPSYSTPTTQTINALMFDDVKQAEVVFNDGSKEPGEASMDYLSKFTAEGERSSEDVNYIKIGYPSDLLMDNVILIDTPGVSDINEQRVQITYDFIPKADAIIFLLDANSPLKGTEKDFIENHLMRNGIKKVLFVANYFDHVEGEEAEEVLAEIKGRISNSIETFETDEINLVPFSAFQALQGVIKNNNQLIEESNLLNVKDRVEKLIFEGNSPENKINTYKGKLSRSIRGIILEFAQSIQADSMSLKELESFVEKLNHRKQNEAKLTIKLNEYVSEHEETILGIIRKSVTHHHSKLEYDVIQKIDIYSGADFKNYVEKHLVSFIHSYIHQWLENAQRSINHMLAILYRELMKGLANHFNTKVANEVYLENELHKDSIYFQLNADDLSNINIKAGVIFGVAAGAALLVGLPYLIPLAGAAGVPALQKGMLNQELGIAKSKIIPEMKSKLSNSFDQLLAGLNLQVKTHIEEILQSSEEQFNTFCNDLQNKMEDVIQSRILEQNALSNNRERIQQKNNLLEEIYKELV